MKIVYIAHPISGEIEGNLKELIRILRIINTNSHPLKNIAVWNEEGSDSLLSFEFSDIVPVAPYYADILALDDNNPEERARGIKNDTILIKAGFFDELWLTGNKISFGMSMEMQLADELGIPVKNYINRI